MSYDEDVIYALATPPGRSGVGVIRVSGMYVTDIIEKISGPITTPRYAYLRKLKNAQGETLDHALVIYFKAPHSFTGEDVVEFHCHGGRAVLNSVLQRIDELDNTREADPGEFTRRALENQKLDLLQVEALGDFISADTEAQRKKSLENFEGVSSNWISDMRESLVEGMSYVTASIDFTDEDLPEDLRLSIGASIDKAQSQISMELENSHRAVSLREGYKVAVVGKPNVGKSSLINKLVGKDVAIATHIPGTTRDVLETFIDLKGIPILLYDTAGIRPTEDIIESIGVEKAQKLASEADIRIFLYEDIVELESLSISPQDHDIILQSKIDINSSDGLGISAITGEGIDQLLDSLINYFSSILSHAGKFSHRRQISALENAQASLNSAKEFYLEGEIVYELLAESLRQSVFALDLLIGKVDVEDLLDVIFSKFCIGK